MALDQKDFLLSEARVIRKEAEDGKNTAERVGKMFVDIINGVADMGDAIDDAINDEVEARQAADTKLQDNIDAEETARSAQDAALQTGIDNEKADREAADTALQGGMDSLQAAIDNEESARASADEALSDAINQESGDRETADTEIIAMIDEMGLAVWPITLDVAASASLMEYNASGTTLTFAGTIMRKGAPVPDGDITSVKFKVGAGSPANAAKKASVNYSVVLSAYGTTEIVMSVEAYGTTASKTFSCTMERAMYFGFSQAAAASDVTLAGLAKQGIKTSPQGDYSLVNDTDGKYLWLCVPKRMSVAKVTSSGFRVPMEAAVESGDYKYYRSSAAILAGTMNITIY